MVVQHNMQAMNANRMLNVTTSTQAKSTEKLSSGYKINRAADDAAGLTISEKMRKQIKGLDQASTNAEDGVSAVQTAEGALTEVHSMLQRMNELAVQASNGTNSESDRSAIQDEISQLTTEIDRVSETTKFKETYLLKGNVDGTSSNVNVAAHDAGLAGKLTANGDGTSTFKLDKALEDGSKVTIAGKEYTIANAIARYRGLDNEEYLYRNMLSNVVNARNKVELTNQKHLSPESISRYVSNILGDSKKDEALIAATEQRYREANEVELYDPLDTEKLATEKIEEIELFREEFHSVLTTANCNTVITVEFAD